MHEDILRRVKSNLGAKFYVTNDIWLRECVEYYLSEHDNPTDVEVLEFAISQWQLSDLRDISNEKPCLPKNLAQEKCTILRGNFMLQMDKVYDIAESKYKQLEKIRNISTDNIRATEFEATQNWEPKKRMLNFHLTDGTQNVTAIEYKPIRFLNDKLLPGYKLMIKGPVTCRRGVIMLDETNVSEIGGEVEALLISNARENVFARAFNLPENLDPYDDNVKPTATEDVLFDDDFDIDLEAVDRLEKCSQKKPTKVPSSCSTDSFSNIRSVSAFNRDVQTESERIDDPHLVPLVHDTGSDLLFDMINENEFENVLKVAPKPRIVSKTICKTPVRVLPRESEFPDDDDDLILITGDTNCSSANTWQKPSSDVKPICQIRDMAKLKIDASVKSVAVLLAPQGNAVVSEKPMQPGNKRTASALSPPVLKQPAEKVRCTQNTPKVNKVNNRKITDYMKKHDRPEDVPSVPKICDDISELLTANVTNNVFCKTVRGKLGKFDKLSRNGDCWELNATLTDPTGSIDVAFSSEILENMLGFSVAEFKQKKKLKKHNPEIENQLRQGFRCAESKLKNLDALLEVQLAPGQKFKIVKIRDITDKQRQILNRAAKLYAT